VVGDGTGPIGPEELFGQRKIPSLGRSYLDRQTVRTAQTSSEENLILTALEKCQWNRTKAAKELGIPRRTFYRKLDKMGLLKKKTPK